MPRCIEQNVEWVTDCLRYLRHDGKTRMAAATEVEEAWTDHVNELAVGTLLSEADSWLFRANIPGKKRTVLMYLGGTQDYRQLVAYADQQDRVRLDAIFRRFQMERLQRITSN